MKFLGREFVRFLLRYKVEALLLLFLTAAAAILSLPISITLSIGFLIIIVGTYTTYRRQTTEETGKSLRDLTRLVDDFENYVFRGKSDPEDFRIIRLLDKMSFPALAPTGYALQEKNWHVDKEEGNARVADLKELHATFQLWLSGFKQKLALLSKMGRLAGKGDLHNAIYEYSDFYNNYVERVAEKIVWLGNRAKIDDRQAAKSIFNIFKENLSHLRGEINTLLKDFQSTSTFIMGEAKAMKGDIEIL